MDKSSDPFSEAREKEGVLECPFHGEKIAMILRHADVVKAAKDWKTFSSDAPLRVPIPSEEDVRAVRQLPLEIDPPEHGDYRAVAEPFFNRAKLPEVIAPVEALVQELVADASHRESIEIVREFAIPLQSRSLAYLLNMPQSEAEIWIGWGMHVFREGDGTSKGAALEVYLNRLYDQGEADPDDSFFSALTRATFRGRPLTREEMLGYGSIMFAGGRDTIIHSVSSIVAYLAKNPQALEYLRKDPKRIVLASEEFFRTISPVTQLGRVCPEATNIHGVTVEAEQRISLCWASANRDERAFPEAGEVNLDRKPNPHVAFGIGTHFCLGAPHARLLVRSLLKKLVERVAVITLVEEKAHVEREARYERSVGYDRLVVRLTPISK